jgi:hypothetical protein
MNILLALFVCAYVLAWGFIFKHKGCLTFFFFLPILALFMAFAQHFPIVFVWVHLLLIALILLNGLRLNKKAGQKRTFTPHPDRP